MVVITFPSFIEIRNPFSFRANE